jgi:hypothetical protein
MQDDTGLYVDARASFSHLLPGRPVLGLVRPDEPADAVVHLQDAPISIRYRLAPPAFVAQSAAEVAWRTAAQIAAWRAGAEVPVEQANPTWHGAWSVESAAVASFPVGDAREELFVLVKDGLVMTVAWTYPAGLVGDPAYASFASVAEATMIWDAARSMQRGRVWPESVFLGPGLYGTPRAKHNERARQCAFAVLAPEERAQLLSILSGVVAGAGAPWVLLRPDVRDATGRAVFGATRDPVIRAFVELALADVRTAHDLRGLAVLLGRALQAQG